MNKYRILIVDDEELSVMSTRLMLEDEGYIVTTASSGAEAVEVISNNPNVFALVVMDYKMSGKDGAATTAELLNLAPDLYILAYSGDPSRDAIQSTWRAGAVEFIEKGCDRKDFLKMVKAWCLKFDRTTRVVDCPEIISEEEHLIASIGMIGRSDALVKVARKINLYQGSHQNVLITGETGTGKELVARALHPNGKMVFAAVNCAAYRANTELMEAELFGYEKGAFTGAIREKKGILESTANGTVFLDEIHHLSLTAQAKLLRVVQEKKIRRVGGIAEIPVTFRLIAAAKPDIEELVAKGEFLPDLYHRINVLSIYVPPLRERIADIEPLIAYFCEQYSKISGSSNAFLARTVGHLRDYPWPGNVRELQNTVCRLLTDHHDEKIAPEHLDAKFFVESSKEPVITARQFKEKIDREERENILAALHSTKSKLAAAKKLGVTPSTMHSMMKRVGLYVQ